MTDNFADLSKRLVDKLRGRPSVPRERRRLSNLLSAKYDRTVQFGPLKGYRMPNESHWGGLARPSMLLGTYELEVVDVLMNCAESRNIFIDVGAADGFFAVGLLVANAFEYSYAFEISSRGRDVIRKSAEINNCSDRVSINGKFDTEYVESNQTINFAQAVILVDIEGAEFNLFDDKMIDLLREAIVIIELHDFHFEKGGLLKDQLINRLNSKFDVRVITTGARQLPRSDFLDGMSDNERWLLCSEGRARRMEWLIASPRCID